MPVVSPGCKRWLAGLKLFALFDAAQPVVTLNDAVKRTDLSRSTTRRFLLTLHELGYVREGGNSFESSAKILHLRYFYSSSAALPQVTESGA